MCAKECVQELRATYHRRLGFKSNSLCYSAGLGNAQTRKQVIFAFIADLQTTSFQGRENLPSQLPSQRKKWIVARATSKTAAPESNTFNDEPTCPYTQSFPQRRNVGEEAVFCMLVMCADHCRKESPSQANRLDSGPSCSQSVSWQSCGWCARPHREACRQSFSNHLSKRNGRLSLTEWRENRHGGLQNHQSRASSGTQGFLKGPARQKSDTMLATVKRGNNLLLDCLWKSFEFHVPL